MSKSPVMTTSVLICCWLLTIPRGANAQSGATSIPRRLTLAEAENLLVDGNLTVIAARYQVEVNRAARLIPSYKPNPVVTVAMEQVRFYSPIKGSCPRFV